MHYHVEVTGDSFGWIATYNIFKIKGFSSLFTIRSCGVQNFFVGCSFSESFPLRWQMLFYQKWYYLKILIDFHLVQVVSSHFHTKMFSKFSFKTSLLLFHKSQMPLSDLRTARRRASSEWSAMLHIFGLLELEGRSKRE